MKLKGPWARNEIDRFLAQASIPVRLSVVGSSRFPIVVSLWYLWDGESLWCATSRAANVAVALEAKPRCGFEVAADSPPYKGVRGQGTATIGSDQDRGLLRRLIDRYLGDDTSDLARWLLDREVEEASIRIAPRAMMAWDYSDRMSGTS